MNGGRSPMSQKKALLYGVIIVSVFFLLRLTNEASLMGGGNLLSDASDHSHAPLLTNNERTQHYAYMHRGKFRINHKYDALERLFQMVKSLGMDRPESMVLAGGTHDGSLAAFLLKVCPSLTFYGFEILPEYYEQSVQALAEYPHASVHHLGLDQVEQKHVQIGGSGRTSGLYNPQGQHNWDLQDAYVDTISLANSMGG